MKDYDASLADILNKVDKSVSKAEDSPISQAVNLILEHAVKAGASSIHIEPRQDGVQVRLRIDGMLSAAHKLPRKVLGALVGRIKFLSNLKIDERRMPQEGRLSMTIDSRPYGLRVSILPVQDGEKIVIHLVSHSKQDLTPEHLGYWGENLRRIKNIIGQPSGLILVTGPADSGKTTSLYSFLSLLNNPKVNLSTIEDPVEYKIDSANQTQVNSKTGVTFTTGLRALLRQDPNIIMVGQIQDSSTADLALQAALTGRLVFGVLYTASAIQAFTRLFALNVEPFLVASTVRAVIAQRLVRRLCPDCKQQYKPDKAELNAIAQIFDFKSKASLGYISELETQAIKENLGKETNAKTSLAGDKIIRLWRANPEGCKICNHSGYKGRIAICEVLVNSQSIQQLITSATTDAAIGAEAIKEGMMTLKVDGLVKALRAQTSIEEVLRATR